MEQPLRILPHIEHIDIVDSVALNSLYNDCTQDYYWSDDFSPQFYIEQAKAGFMAVTELHKDKELLLPELQKRYAVLDFDDLHISRHVKRLLSQDQHTLHIGLTLEKIHEEIRRYHPRSWVTAKYLETLEAVNKQNDGVTVIAVSLKHQGQTTAGELGYIIGSTYTSLSGFSSRDPRYKNNGTLQLVMLAKWLKKHNFAFWNLGQPYMPYKFAIGAKKYSREAYLKQWHDAISEPLSKTVRL